MFNGIVEGYGRVLQQMTEQASKAFCFERPASFETLSIGESIAVNGVCLTVTRFDEASFWVTVVPETWLRTNLNQLNVDDYVNLERSLKVDGRISGHFVQGHVDATGTVLSFDVVGADGQPLETTSRPPDRLDAMLLKIGLPEPLSRYVVSKGYIAVDGMSVTVIDAAPTWFTITLIPHTRSETISQYYRIGCSVNLEVDMMAKYVEKFVGVSADVR